MLANNAEQQNDATTSKQTNKNQTRVSAENFSISTNAALYFLVVQWELR